MLKLFIDPLYTRPDQADGGIRRVTEAMAKYLPQFDIEVVDSVKEAELINNHGASLTERPGIPMVASCHGLYWANHDWPHWAHEVNAQVVNVLKRAIAHTAPSQWVAHAMTRGMLVYPEVILHGVDSEEWTPADPSPYVLWNKARIDPVSDCNDMQQVARLLPKVQFISTFGEATSNVQITGRMPVHEMRAMVKHAGLYLATARETFGIGTLEALACGVPVVGWDWGGQSEIILHGETGYLAEPGNYQQLAECIDRATKERKRLSKNARQDAVKRWGWLPRIEQYADLFKKVASGYYAPRPKISVLVTAYNLGAYLHDALASVQKQTLKDFECLIIDDCSVDNTAYIARSFGSDKRFHYHKTPHNLGLVGALNYGFSLAQGHYVISLDADNIFNPYALAELSKALDIDPSLHIAFGHLDTMSEDGNNIARGQWPGKSFDWLGQAGHLNQITSTAMLRREVWERVGGYRSRHYRAEDAQFWLRATSLGFTARKVTELSVFTYRNRSDSKSKGEHGDGDWTAWYPWSVPGASSGPEGAKLLRAGKRPNYSLVPWGVDYDYPTPKKFWPVHDHTRPIVSVIIPVGPGHEQFLIDALDSIVAQDYLAWEVIVVFDDGREVAPRWISGAPYAKVYTTGGQYGPGVARNLGAKHAKGEVLYFLDADDYLLPHTLKRMVEAWRLTGYLIYGDWLRNDSDKTPLTHYAAWDYECATNGKDHVEWKQHDGSTITAARGVLGMMLHSVNVLVPRHYHELIGGFDENMPGWEDWDYFIALQKSGLCSYRIPEPLFVYRFRKGTRRESSFGDGQALKTYLFNKYREYYTGEKSLMCGCTGTNPASLADQALATLGPLPQVPLADSDMMLVSYNGSLPGPLSITGPVTQVVYRFGHESPHAEKYVSKLDYYGTEQVEGLGSRFQRGVQIFQVVTELKAPEPEPVVSVDSYTESSIKAEPITADMPVMDGVEFVIKPKRSDVPHIDTYSIRLLKQALKDASLETVESWLVQERIKQPIEQRSTVLTMLESALDRMRQRVTA